MWYEVDQTIVDAVKAAAVRHGLIATRVWGAEVDGKPETKHIAAKFEGMSGAARMWVDTFDADRLVCVAVAQRERVAAGADLCQTP